MDVRSRTDLQLGMGDAYVSADDCIRIAKSYSHLGYQTQAIAYFSGALELNPMLTNAIYERAGSYSKKRYFSMAEEDFSWLLELSQRNSFAITNRAYTFYARKCYSHAHFDLEKALTLNPDNVFAYLFRGMLHRTIENDAAAEKDFLQVWQRANAAHVKLYAGIQLHKYNKQDIHLEPLIRELEEKVIKTAEEYCVLAVAYMTTTKTELAKQTCLKLIGAFLPEALPHYLQKDYLLLLMNVVLVNNDIVSLRYIDQFKTQLVDLICSMDDRNILLNAGIQALCRNNLPGHILYIKRGHSQPTILAGRLRNLAQEIDYILQTKSPQNFFVKITPASKKALHEEMLYNPRFASDLQNCYPHLYKFVKKNLFIMQTTTPLLFARNASHSIQAQNVEEEGNRFIVDL